VSYETRQLNGEAQGRDACQHLGEVARQPATPAGSGSRKATLGRSYIHRATLESHLYDLWPNY